MDQEYWDNLLESVAIQAEESGDNKLADELRNVAKEKHNKYIDH